MEALTTIKA